MNYVDRLLEALKQQLRHPWSRDRSGGERVWFLVYDADKTRGVLARKDSFRLATEAAGKRWAEIDLSLQFGQWLSGHRYAARYFARPHLASTIADGFAQHLVDSITREIREREVDEQTLLVLTGTEALYGITKLSPIIKRVEDAVPGRLLVLFPGQYTEPTYRFLDARDGWNYLAVPIVPVTGKGAR